MRELLFQALASAGDGAFAVDGDQRIVYWNRAAERILGYYSGRTVGQPCYEVLNGKDADSSLICHRHCDVGATALGGGQVPNFDMLVHTKLGDPRWLDVSTFVFPSNGQASGALVVHLFRDITPREQIEGLLQQVLAAADRLREKSEAPGFSPTPVADVSAELTEREREVLSLLARGASTADMARLLSISRSTVRNHVRNILDKFGVHSRIEAVLYAVKEGLITLD
jgi:PAS domain S-box-containing protein